MQLDYTGTENEIFFWKTKNPHTKKMKNKFANDFVLHWPVDSERSSNTKLETLINGKLC